MLQFKQKNPRTFRNDINEETVQSHKCKEKIKYNMFSKTEFSSYYLTRTDCSRVRAWVVRGGPFNEISSKKMDCRLKGINKETYVFN